MFLRLFRKIKVPIERALVLPDRDEPERDIPAKWVDHDCYIIEYTDEQGSQSTRRVAVKNFKDGYMYAYCFEREAHRTFSLDRISGMFDFENGKPADPKPHAVGRGTVAWAETPDIAQREPLIPQVTFLRTIALCDGHAAKRENDIITNYIYGLMVGNGLADTPEHIARTDSWIRRFYPDRIVADEVIPALGKLSKNEISELISVGEQLIRADGVIAQEEVNVLKQLGDEILAAYRANK